MENHIPKPDSEADKDDDSHPLDFDHSLKTTYFPSGGDTGFEVEQEITVVEEETPKKTSPNSIFGFFNGGAALKGMSGVWLAWAWACVAWVFLWPHLACIPTL